MLTKILKWVRERSGNVTPLITLMLVPIVGGLGMAAEGSNWWLTQRAAQNAADSAAMSASWNGGATAAGTGTASSYSTANCSTNPSYFDCEAVGAAAQAGFANGSNSVVVYPQYLTDVTTPACPNSLKACYKVTVTRTLPVYLLALPLRGQSSQTVQAVAYAALVSTGNTTADCLFILGKSGGTALTANGAPKANLTGCDVQIGSTYSTGLVNATCNGGNLKADAAFATGTDNGCGNQQVSNATAVGDPYATLASSIPSDTCGGSYGGASLSSDITANTTLKYCGDVTLGKTVNVTGNATMVIYNGSLDVNGNTLQTTGSGTLTIVFAGTNSSSYTHTLAVSKNGTIDISAPTSGTWSGISIYQAPNLTQNVDFSDQGNGSKSLTLDLSGVLYQPNANDTLGGVIGKSSSGASCFIMVVNTMTINGTGGIFQGNQSQCGTAGVTQVFSGTPVHELVG